VTITVYLVTKSKLTEIAHLIVLVVISERQGFEPWEVEYTSTVFKTAALNRSAISPGVTILKTSAYDKFYVKIFLLRLNYTLKVQIL
jgi:hypothetical protein